MTASTISRLDKRRYPRPPSAPKLRPESGDTVISDHQGGDGGRKRCEANLVAGDREGDEDCHHRLKGEQRPRKPSPNRRTSYRSGAAGSPRKA